jgi:hypothetical protein
MVQYVEARCAVVQLDDGLVINIIVAQPSNEPQIGCKLIEIASGEPCDIGWIWNGSTFVNPSPPLPDAEG